MPLPLGHAVIGLTVHDVCSKNNSALSRWKVAVFVMFLAILPDIDVVVGLLVHGNGSAFHRGPTHSLFFALGMGFLASIAWRLWSHIPTMSFGTCFALVLSHVLADFLFTSSRVSLFWPFEVNWAIGHKGWVDVMNLVFLKAFRDTGIIMGCGMVVFLNRLARRYSDTFRTLTNQTGRVYSRANHGCRKK